LLCDKKFAFRDKPVARRATNFHQININTPAPYQDIILDPYTRTCIGEVPQKTPLFLSLQESRKPTHSSAHIDNVTICELEKMSQSFSNNTNSLNTYTAINVSNNFTVADDDRSNILTWLSPLDPKLRHQDIQDRRVEDVGEWLLQTKEYRNWQAGDREGESDNAVLFCYGDPGVGKTYIR